MLQDVLFVSAVVVTTDVVADVEAEPSPVATADPEVLVSADVES